ncbi:MAG: nitroreductase family deazaflavin-dependent oxidoreductase [Actinomycetes bacterium]
MPNDLQLKTMNLVHRLILTASFGKIGWGAMGMPVIELTTIGRKSGQPRSTMLTSPWQEGDSYVIVASRGGDDRHPAWFLNLRDNPAVEARIGGGPKQKMHARVADAQERAHLWPKLTADHKNYAGYQANTEREIPVVILEPVTEDTKGSSESAPNG